jgi:hypothetical protein
LNKGSNDPEINQYITYFAFADRFGWLPEEVDKLPSDLVDAFGTIFEDLNKKNQGSMSNKQVKRWHLK